MSKWRIWCIDGDDAEDLSMSFDRPVLALFDEYLPRRPPKPEEMEP